MFNVCKLSHLHFFHILQQNGIPKAQLFKESVAKVLGKLLESQMIKQGEIFGSHN